jgi:DNA-binding NarL/FixJ family response regulator
MMQQTLPPEQMPPTVMPAQPRPRKAQLDDRDKRIVQAIAEGHSNKAIAQQMEISEQTVKNRLTAIYQLMGVKTRLELAVYALRDGSPLKQMD